MKLVNKFKRFFIGHKVWTVIIIIAIIGVGYYTYNKMNAGVSSIQYTFGKVKTGDLVLSVNATGQVSTLSKVSLKPNTTGQTQTLGQITSVRVKNGDTVYAGQVIAILDGKNALQSLNQAKATVASSQANYNKVVTGLTEAETLSLNNSLVQSQTTLDNAKQNILIKLKTAYTTASNSVYLNTDSLFSNPLGNNPTFVVSGAQFNNMQLQNNVNQGRYYIGPILETWRLNNKTLSVTDLPTAINKAISDLNTERNYFDDMTALTSQYSNAYDSSGQSAINSAKSAASSARGSIDSLISDLTSTLQSYNNNVISLQQTKDNIMVKTKPPTADDLAVAQASLDNAKSNLANAETTYASRIITAPFDGQIGGLSAEVGQSVSSADSLGTLITAEKVINVTLNEVDAAKISANNPVTVTFDSLPGVSLSGRVAFIDPLGTVTQGVVSYAAQIKMSGQNDQIKTAMTASVSIETAKHTGVLIIPTSAITTMNGKKFVLVADIASSNGSTSTSMWNRNNASSTGDFSSSTRRDFGSSTRGSSTRPMRNIASSTTNIVSEYPVKNVEITVGISNNTSTEILSGLSDGQMIVTKKTTVSAGAAKTSAASATTNTRSGFGGMGGPGAIGGIHD